MIPQSFIEDIQTKTDIVEVISSYIPLKRAGRNFKAVCPFHHEKTPSFFVNPQKQIFHCFGCGEGGSVIQFLMLYEKVTFPEAIEILAKRLGLSIPYQRTDNITKLYEAMQEAVVFFNKNLLDNKYTGPLKYLEKRGILIDTIKKFYIGYAPGKNSLLEYLRNKGFSLENLEKTSLIVAKEDGYRDLFWDRIVFPIFDVRSRPIAFGARIWKEINDAPKYINSFESPIYKKREHLFGLNFAKEEILNLDSVIVVEGYLDMIIPYIFGIKNIVASLGTALTEEQINLIKRYTKNIILIFDSDKAGESATIRAMDLLLENDIRPKIVLLEKGYDPDLLIREKGKDYFLKLLSQKLDFFDYKILILRKSYDIESIEGKSNIADKMLSAINKLNSEVEKYEYIKKLSNILNIKEELLLAELKKTYYKKDNAFGVSQKNIKELIPLTEKIIFKFILNNPDLFSVAKKNLKEEDFTSNISKKTFSYFLKNDFNSKTIGTILDKEINSFITGILMDEEIPLDKELFKSGIIKLVKNRTKILKEKIRENIRDAEKNNDRKMLKILIDKYNKIGG